MTWEGEGTNINDITFFFQRRNYCTYPERLDGVDGAHGGFHVEDDE